MINKIKNWGKYFYIWIILIIFYIPLFVMAIFSFNQTSTKGFVSFHWNGFSSEAYQNLFSSKMLMQFANSLILGFFTCLIVIVISLLTVFSLWRQKNKTIKIIKNISNNISLINPDVIIGISLGLFFTISVGTLAATREGLLRAIIGHSVMSLPYGILIMYPKSEKFSKSIFEASQDLGYSKIKTWFKTYFVFMLPSIFFVFLVTMIFSFDDFIITRITSNTSTIGTSLYQGHFQSWALALGTILIIFVFIFNIYFYIHKSKKNKTK